MPSFKLFALPRGLTVLGVDRLVIPSVILWSAAEEDGRRRINPFTSSLNDLAFFSILEAERLSENTKKFRMLVDMVSRLPAFHFH